MACVQQTKMMVQGEVHDGYILNSKTETKSIIGKGVTERTFLMNCLHPLNVTCGTMRETGRLVLCKVLWKQCTNHTMTKVRLEIVITI